MFLKIKIQQYVKSECGSRLVAGDHVFEVTVNSDHIINIQPTIAHDANGVVFDRLHAVVTSGFEIHLSDGRKITSTGDYVEVCHSIDDQLSGV